MAMCRRGWSRHGCNRTSVHTVRRLCERPGCAGQAEVSYGIDHSTLVVWVDNKAVSERDHAGRLCRRHANALSVPRGWTIDDRRELVPKLFVVRTSDEDETPPAKKKRVASAEKKPKKAASRPRPSLFEANDGQRAAENQKADTEVVSTVDQHIEDPDETRAIPWSPRLASTATAPDEAEEGEAPVFGRLLGRAFGQRGPEE